MRIYESDVLTINKVGGVGGEAYLALTPNHALLYDSGFAHSAPQLVCEVEALLKGRNLDYLFLSHSHYDHVSGSVWVKERWPEVVIMGSAHAAHVLQRPGARKTIKDLNESAVLELESVSLGLVSLESAYLGSASLGLVTPGSASPGSTSLESASLEPASHISASHESEAAQGQATAASGLASTACSADETSSSLDLSKLEKLSIDKTVAEGDLIDMGAVSFEVIEAPGHTRCSLMLWCPEERLLFGSETLGVLVDEKLVTPAYLTGYHDSLAAIDKAVALDPEHILANHRDVISGEKAKNYLRNARYWAEETARWVWEGRAEGKSEEELIALIKNFYFSMELRAFQPEAAFDINNVALVKLLLACDPSATDSDTVQYV